MKKNTRKFDDYLKLPFEIYYSDSLNFKQMEFVSFDIPKNFSEIKGVDEREGWASGLTFRCNHNSGPELACCILNSHDYIIPEWLELQDEENAEINCQTRLAVSIEDNKIRFQNFSENNQTPGSDEYIDIDNMEPCGIDGFHVYEFDETAPEYIILDPDNSRVKVNLNGCILDENGEETGEILFDPIKIEEMVELMEFNWNGLLEEAIKKWVKETLEKDFPQQSHLEFVYSF
jgi:hypothetical protein